MSTLQIVLILFAAQAIPLFVAVSFCRAAQAGDMPAGAETALEAALARTVLAERNGVFRRCRGIPQRIPLYGGQLARAAIRPCANSPA